MQNSLRTSYQSQIPTQQIQYSDNEKENQQKRLYQENSIKIITQIKAQLKYISTKLSDINNKRYCSDQRLWSTLQSDIYDVLEHLACQRPIEKVFERKFRDELRMLNDLYKNKYSRSFIQAYFLCCPSSFLQRFKRYQFVQQLFQRSVSVIPNIQRNIYYYILLLYTKLYLIFGMLKDKIQEQKNRNLIQQIHTQSKKRMQILSKKNRKSKQFLQQIKKEFLDKHLRIKKVYEKDKETSKQGRHILRLQSKQKKQIRIDKKQQKNQKKQQKHKQQNIQKNFNPQQTIKSPEQLQNNIIIQKRNFLEQYVKLLEEVEALSNKDWQQIISNQQWSQSSYIGYIQMNQGTPILTSLQFKDCKMKTDYLFQQISSTSFDLRAYLIRKSQYGGKNNQFICEPLYSDSCKFKLRFWIQQQKLKQQQISHRQMIQKFIFQTMRIGIKQKISRMCSIEYKQKIKTWLIDNYIHLAIKQQFSKSRSRINLTQTQSMKQKQTQKQEEEGEYQKDEKQQAFDLWWANLGEKLIKAIIEVSNKKVFDRNSKIKSLKSIKGKKKSSAKTMSFIPSENPQTNERLTNSRNSRAVYQI